MATRRIVSTALIALVVGSFAASRLGAQTFALEVGPTLGLDPSSETVYRSSSGLLAGTYDLSDRLRIRAGYEYLSTEDRDGDGGTRQLTGHNLTIGAVLRAPFRVVSPYVRAGAGLGSFTGAGGDRTAPAAPITEAGVGLEIVGLAGTAWLLEARALVLFTGGLSTAPPVVLWPAMVGLRFYPGG